MNKKLLYFIQPGLCHRNHRCLWPIHPVFPEGAGETYFTGLRRAMLDPVPSPKAVNGGATARGTRGGSPRECQGSGVTGVTGFYN